MLERALPAAGSLPRKLRIQDRLELQWEFHLGSPRETGASALESSLPPLRIGPSRPTEPGAGSEAGVPERGLEFIVLFLKIYF